jgi:FtsH-binding integral membrane protein
MQGVSKRRLQTKACIAGAKTFLMLFNIIFWVIGLIILILGLWMRASITRLFEVSREFNFALPSLFIMTGTAMLVIGFFACSCTSNENPKLLYGLAGFFFVVFILVFSSSITGYVYRDTLKDSLHSSLNQTLQDYGSGGIMDKDWDRIQENVSYIIRL